MISFKIDADILAMMKKNRKRLSNKDEQMFETSGARREILSFRDSSKSHAEPADRQASLGQDKSYYSIFTNSYPASSTAFFTAASSKDAPSASVTTAFFCSWLAVAEVTPGKASNAFFT